MFSITLLGILLGLGAAFWQSLSYLATRQYVQRRGGGSRTLLALSHVLMGCACGAALPWAWPATQQAWSALLPPLAAVSIFYAGGQLCLMLALRHTEASRVSPMLAFKVVILAALTVFLGHKILSPLQWIAVGTCVGGAMALHYSGGRTSRRALLAIILACVFYSLSDWNITLLVSRVQGVPRWQAFIWSTLICYSLCGVLAVGLLPWFGSRRAVDWAEAIPFAFTWLAAMFMLFACFGLVGVLYGNILQSTRGIMSVLMGGALSRWGLIHLEQARPRRVWVRRLAAAALMTAAVVLYAVERGGA